jgi:hypothetical protein
MSERIIYQLKGTPYLAKLSSTVLYLNPLKAVVGQPFSSIWIDA